MREIKFRAWDDYTKTMITNPDDIPIYYETDNGLHSGYTKENGDWTTLRLMQYTGLKDKNGKEIYEGDVVDVAYKTVEDVRPFEIVYLNNDIGCGFHMRSSKEVMSIAPGGSPFKTDDYINSRYAADIEIIGNIHEKE